MAVMKEDAVSWQYYITVGVGGYSWSTWYLL